MRYRYESGGRVYDVTVEKQGERTVATVDGQPFELDVLDAQPGQISLMFEGRPVTLYYAAEGPRRWFSLTGCTYRLDKPAPRSTRGGGEAGAGESVRAPMPAQVRSVEVAEGDEVAQGDTLLLLEAMKMEIRVKAPAAGRVTRLLVASGQQVEKDQLLAEIGA